jgi:outer membrane protease
MTLPEYTNGIIFAQEVTLNEKERLFEEKNTKGGTTAGYQSVSVFW